MDDTLFLDDIILGYAETTPEKVAIIAEETSITYRDLERRVNGLCRALKAAAVNPGDYVAMILAPGVSVIPALLATIRMGAIYTPLDPKHPDNQLAEKLRDIGCKVAFTDLDSNERIGQWTDIQIIAAKVPGIDQSPALPSRSLQDTACIFFTSGTTGKPRGVTGTAQAMRDSMIEPSAALGFSEADTLNSIARYAWSISMLELMAALVQGGTTLMLDNRKALEMNWLIDQSRRCSAFHCPPALLKNLANYVASTQEIETINNTRLVWYGGDNFKPKEIDALKSTFPNATIGTAYGTTEIFGLSHFHLYSSGKTERVLIGAPVPNMGQRLLTEDGNPATPGDIAEIYMSGPRIAQGYRDQPQFTKERFPTIDGIRYFKSGDFALVHEDGVLEFLERRDSQVKIRGIRVELGEIEQAILAHSEVQEVCVLAVAAKNDEKELRAYVVTQSDETPLTEVKTKLAQVLPDYLQPAQWLQLSQLPYTENFKIDRRKLASMSDTRDQPSALTSNHPLAGIWQQLTNYQPSPDDNFFSIGGNSLLVIQLVMKIKNTFGVQVEVADIYRCPKLAAQIDLISSQSAQIKPDLDLTQVYASKGQVGLFFRELMGGKAGSITCTRYLRSEQPIDEDLVRRTIKILLDTYPTLTTNIKMSRPNLVLIEKSHLAESIHVFRSDKSWTLNDGHANSLAKQALKFDVRKDPLLGGIIIPLQDGSEVLQLTAHHIGADDNSMGRIAIEFASIYAALEQESNIEPIAPALNYLEFAADQFEKIQSGYFTNRAKEIARRLVSQLPILTEQPLLPRSPENIKDALLTKHVITKSISKYSQKHFMAALSWSLSKITGRFDFTFCAHVALRRDTQANVAVGMYINLIPIFTGFNPKHSPQEHLARSAEDFDEAMARSDLIYEEIVELDEELKSKSIYPYDALINEIFYNEALHERFEHISVDTLFGTDRANLNMTAFQTMRDRFIQLETPSSDNASQLHNRIAQLMLMYLQTL